jgi:tRNA pseudouridine55 synthase
MVAAIDALGANDVPAEAGDSRVGGLLILNKPKGVGSRKLVDQVARHLPRVKAGHAGTLDPLATGILVVCVGPATRLVQNVQDLPKTYRTLVHLGARSDTLDADGRIEVEPAPKIPSADEVREAIRPLVGVVSQTPPAYSAKRIGGKRAYDLARAGQVLELAARPVRIDRIAVLEYSWPHLFLEIDCGGGTYIRSIARDIGDALTCGGYVETLIRTRTGPFALEHAIDPAELSAASIKHLLRPSLEAVPNLVRIVLEPGQVEAIIQGKRLATRDLARDSSGISGSVALIDSAGRLVALAEIDLSSGTCQPRKVLI